MSIKILFFQEYGGYGDFEARPVEREVFLFSRREQKKRIARTLTILIDFYKKSVFVRQNTPLIVSLWPSWPATPTGFARSQLTTSTCARDRN